MSGPTENNLGKTIARRLNEMASREKAAVAKMRGHFHISRDTNQEFNEKQTFGERFADNVAAFGGSWTFIGLFTSVLVFWIVLNSILMVKSDKVLDPFPYMLMNLVLSMLAAIQAPVIMMSQNRQTAKDRLDAENDYQVNLKAELEILSLHEKLDDLRDKKWAELMEIQQTQINTLSQLLKDGAAATNR